MFVQPLTKAYSTQIHTFANTNIFSFVRSRNFPDPSMLYDDSAFSIDTKYAEVPQPLRAQLYACIGASCAQASTMVTSTKSWYMRNYDRNFTKPPTFSPGLVGKIPKPPLVAFAVEDADIMSARDVQQTYTEKNGTTLSLWKLSSIR